MTPRPFRLAAYLCLAGGLSVSASTLGAQTAFDAPPNLAQAWTLTPGVLQFNLLHRFWLGPEPSRKLLNAPTLSVGIGLQRNLMLGVNYATSSEIATSEPNEFEVFGRGSILRQGGRIPVDLLVQGGYNTVVENFDGEAIVARSFGPVRAIAVLGLLGEAFEEGRTRVSVGGGATVRIAPFLGLAGDLVSLTDRRDDEDVAWSAGLMVGIQGTPHTLSLHASNVASRTVQGMARGSGRTRYGFEYTIPINLTRAPARPTRTEGATQSARGTRDTVWIDVRGMRFVQNRVEVEEGTTVVWRNADPLVHTVTMDDGTIHSGDISAGREWGMVFETRGRFSYHCTPHPFMQGQVVVVPRRTSSLD